MGEPRESKKPAWWSTNEQLRNEMELPPYDPPRFRNGVYTHEVVPSLKDEYNCTVQFAVINPEYPEDWYVRADGEAVMSIGRH